MILFDKQAIYNGLPLKAFEEIASSLADYTEKVVISFVDLYAKTQRNTKELGIRQMTMMR